MELTVKLLKETDEETLSKLYANGVFVCYVLEDQYRATKVKGDTRIPAGRYKVILRTEGTTHAKYAASYPKIHKGMLWLLDVPGFDYILIHKGNNDKDTAGCLLVGNDKAEHNGRITLVESEKAYLRLYPEIARLISSGVDVWIEITR